MASRIQVRKATRVAIALHAMQIAAFALCGALLLSGRLSMPDTARYALLAALLLLIVANAQGIRDDLILLRIEQQEAMLRDAIAGLGELNNRLTAHRHDFLNHLQVIYSLCEMGDTKDAVAYIERCYGALRQVTRSIKTAKPAINALLQAKAGVAEQKGIAFAVEMHSSWARLPMPDWEMCRVLGNLLDNAMDALCDTKEPAIHVRILEDLRTFGFEVENNGPMVPIALRSRIFEQGVTTKASGQGQGLYIVRSLMRGQGGEIVLTSTPDKTVFAGYLPRAHEAAEGAEGASSPLSQNEGG